MTTYERIRERRNKVIPPVLEFGCEVVIKVTEKGIRKGIKYQTTNWENDFIINGTEKDKNMGRYKTCHYGIKSKDELWRVLGKPVTLNDILLMGRFRSIDVWGNIKIVGKRQKEGNFISEKEIILCKLKLTKDIEHQEEEVLLKILEIIK